LVAAASAALDLLRARLGLGEAVLDRGREMAHQIVELLALHADVGEQVLQRGLAVLQREVDGLLFGREVPRPLPPTRRCGRPCVRPSRRCRCGSPSRGGRVSVTCEAIAPSERCRICTFSPRSPWNLAELRAGGPDDAVERGAGLAEPIQHEGKGSCRRRSPVAASEETDDSAPCAIASRSAPLEASSSWVSRVTSPPSASVERLAVEIGDRAQRVGRFFEFLGQAGEKAADGFRRLAGCRFRRRA